jgi:DNA-binding transcriptional LysR family regulator
MHEAATRVFEASGFPPGNVHEVATLHDMTAMVANGLGAAILPRSSPQIDSIRRMQVTDLPLTRTVSAYAVAGRRRETAAAAFLNLLRSSDVAAA